jgi:hypothetical protein
MTVCLSEQCPVQRVEVHFRAIETRGNPVQTTPYRLSILFWKPGGPVWRPRVPHTVKRRKTIPGRPLLLQRYLSNTGVLVEGRVSPDKKDSSTGTPVSEFPTVS